MRLIHYLGLGAGALAVVAYFNATSADAGFNLGAALGAAVVAPLVAALAALPILALRWLYIGARADLAALRARRARAD